MERFTNKYFGLTSALFLLCITAITNPVAGAGASSFRNIDVPWAISTEPQAINNRGMIVGYFADDPAQPLTDESGFMQLGRFVTAIDHPDAESTSALGMNDRGEIVGAVTVNGDTVPYVLSEGEFTLISLPERRRARARGINNRRKVVGHFTVTRVSERGFLFDDGAVTLIDVPNSFSTVPRSINDKDQIVGHWIDNSRVTHGFLLSNGVYTTIDVPNSESTSVRAINNRGQMVGNYRDGTGDHGFLLHRGRFTTIDLSVPQERTNVLIADINDHGEITGTYFDLVAQKTRGFTVNVRDFLD